MNTPSSDPTTCCPPIITALFSACGLDFEDVGYDWLDVIVMAGEINDLA